MKAFSFHYNKPATAAAGSPKLTVHVGGQCKIVDAVECEVPVRSRTRSKQPRVVMSGRGVVRVKAGVAHITEV